MDLSSFHWKSVYYMQILVLCVLGWSMGTIMMFFVAWMIYLPKLLWHHGDMFRIRDVVLLFNRKIYGDLSFKRRESFRNVCLKKRQDWNRSLVLNIRIFPVFKNDVETLVHQHQHQPQSPTIGTYYAQFKLTSQQRKL